LTLVRKEFVRPDRSEFLGDDGFRFGHILIRDAAYDATPKARRAELHERYADWLEGKSIDAIEYEEILGYHLEQAYRYKVELGPLDAGAVRLAAAAGERLAAAGRRAYLRGDMPAAAGLLRRACDLLPTSEGSRPALLLELGSVLIEAGDLAGADAVFAEAESAGEPVAPRAAIERQMLASAMEVDFNAEEAREHVGRAIELFESCGDERGLARALLFRGEVANELWNRTEMATSAARSAEHARRLGDHRAEAEALRLFGGALVYGPVPASEGIDEIERLLAQGVPNQMVEAALVAPLSALTAMRGDFRRARELVDRATHIYGELGLTFQLARLGFMSGIAERLAGDLEAAERSLRAGTDRLYQIGERSRFTGMALQLANVLCDRGKIDEADALLQLVDEVEDPFFNSTRGRILAHRGDPAGESMARRAMEDAAATDDVMWRIDSVKNVADALLLQGRAEEAASVLEDVLVLCDAKGNIAEAAATQELIEEIHAGVP
jgi:tetratricopeptide (TPR) repeat protein